MVGSEEDGDKRVSWVEMHIHLARMLFEYCHSGDEGEAAGIDTKENWMSYSNEALYHNPFAFHDLHRYKL